MDTEAKTPGSIWGTIGGSWASHDHVRHWYYASVFETITNLEYENRVYSLVEFGCREPSSSIIRMFKWKLGDNCHPRAVEYPEYDIQNVRQFSDGQWDIVVADQVLEHVERPWLGAEEIYRITKTGGLTIIGTPIILHVHPNPKDCWRIMPDGYKVIFPEEKWEWLNFGLWGDMHIVAWECESPITRGFTGDWLPVSQAKEIIPNYGPGTDGVWPIVAWLCARKR